MKKLQEGFSAVEGLLIVVILGMLASIGWYVWHSQRQVDNTYSKIANSSAVPSKKVSSGPTAAPTPVSPAPEQAYTTTYSKVPADLQAAIANELKKEYPTCVNSNGQIVSEVDPSKVIDPRVDYDTLGFAGTGIGCGEGAWGVFAKVSGKWQFLSKTQYEFKCSLLSQYHYPQKLLALNSGNSVQCLDSNNNPSSYNG
jgi:hypothetical protein